MMPASSETLTHEAKKLVVESISEIRQLSASIKPPSFKDNMLVESIETLTQDIRRVQKIGFNIDSSHLDETKLADAHMLLVYRVVQEQLTNITKYSGANKVDINLSASGDVVNIEIIDNGKGFDPERVKNGIGLRNIQSRLQVYKGKMKISSAPGNGCTLRATFNTKNN
jgi:signal transduction histidine kinase